MNFSFFACFFDRLFAGYLVTCLIIAYLGDGRAGGVEAFREIERIERKDVLDKKCVS